MIRPPFVLRPSYFVLLATLLLQGCQSYTIVQQNVFADDDGSVLFLEYGRSESDHVNTFVSPVTGKEMEFKSRLMVRAQFSENVPDCLEVRNGGSQTNRIVLADETIKAWQCMNFLSRGTMYETDGGEWKLLVNGFSTAVYRRMADAPPRYLEVYRGVLCDINDSYKAKKDERWKTVPKSASSADSPVRR